MDVQDPQTYDREVRALAAAAGEYRSARALLVTLESMPPTPSLPAPLEWRCAADWLLGEPAAARGRRGRWPASDTSVPLPASSSLG